MNYNILVLIIISSIIIFILLVKGFDYVPHKYYDNIALMEGIGICIIIASTIIGFYIDSSIEAKEDKNEYINSIIGSFNKIDDFLLKNSNKYRMILKILYQKVQLPSSDENIKDIFKTITSKEKDILFLIYNKLTYNFEKIYHINPILFDNNNLGMRVRLYIDNIFYYEFWNNTHNLFKTEFVDFMNKKYNFLTFDNVIYSKPNRNLNRYSEGVDKDFVYNSPTYSTSWKNDL